MAWTHTFSWGFHRRWTVSFSPQIARRRLLHTADDDRIQSSCEYWHHSISSYISYITHSVITLRAQGLNSPSSSWSSGPPSATVSAVLRPPSLLQSRLVVSQAKFNLQQPHVVVQCWDCMWRLTQSHQRHSSCCPHDPPSRFPSCRNWECHSSIVRRTRSSLRCSLSKYIYTN